MALFGQTLAEAHLAGRAVSALMAAEEAEVDEAPLQKMFGGQPAHGRVVHVDGGRVEVRQGAGDVHQRNAQPQDGAGDAGIEEVGDDAVGFPFPQGTEDFGLRGPVAEDPVSLFDGVGADAAEHVAAEARILPHQQGNPLRLGHATTRSTSRC